MNEPNHREKCQSTPRLITNTNAAIATPIIKPFAIFFISFSVWRGKLHEKRSLAILFLISAALFLVVCINMLSRFAISLPLPSQEWLASMALSRAHTLGKAPVIDDLILTQGRLVTLGMAAISLIVSLVLAWFGKNWFNEKTQS